MSTRTCGKCDKSLSNKNKTGFCVRHNKNGSMNPMFGKNVYQSWVDKYGKEGAGQRQTEADTKRRDASTRNWEDPEYRQRVKGATTGLKRTCEFRETQRKNAIEQFKDQSQRDLRSEAIKKSYENGIHNPDTLCGNQYGNRGFNEDGIFYASDIERKRMAFLKESGVTWKRYSVNDFDFRIRYTWNNNVHLYIPDFVIWKENKIIIEELKMDLSRISEREQAKIDAAYEFFKHSDDFEYRAVDNVRHAC